VLAIAVWPVVLLALGHDLAIPWGSAGS